MFDFLNDLEYGMDLAATASILIAALSFIWQSVKQRKMKRDSEIWRYFKQVNEDVSNIQLEITDVLAKELHYREDGLLVTKGNFFKTVSKVINLTNKLLFHVKYNTQQDIQNILEYYDVKGSKSDKIQEIINTTISRIEFFIDYLLEELEKWKSELTGVDEVTEVNKEYTNKLSGITIFEEYIKDKIKKEREEGNLPEIEKFYKDRNKTTLDVKDDNQLELAIIQYEAFKELNSRVNKKNLENLLSEPGKAEEINKALEQEVRNRERYFRFKYHFALVKSLNEFNKDLMQEILILEESCLSRVIRKITMPFRIITKPFRIIADAICK